MVNKTTQQTKLRKNVSYNLIVSIDKFFNLGGDMSSSLSKFVMAQGLAQNEATQLAEALNKGYKQFYSETPEKEPRTYTADFWSNRTALGYGDVRRKYYAKEDSKTRLKSQIDRKKIIEKLEGMLADKELFGSIGRRSYFYETELGGFCQYHGC